MSDPDYHSETVDGHTFRLRFLPGGVFDMGSEDKEGVIWKESPVHPVRLSPFYIGEFPVTQALWKAVMGTENNPAGFQGNLRPVDQVSWTDIVEGNQYGNGRPAFLDRLNELTEETRPEGRRYRLPTEAEWEYAARAGAPYLYAGGDKLKEVGWYDLNSHGETKEVAGKRSNDFGLYDMSGNVWEWCFDWAEDSYYQECLDAGVVENPMGPKQGRLRVLRGGGWIFGSRFCRVSCRDGLPPWGRGGHFGFRLVLSPQFTQ